MTTIYNFMLKANSLKNLHVKSNHTFVSVLVNISIKEIEIQRPNMFHFKAFGMIDLHYKIRICQKKIYNRVTMTVYFKCVV